MNKSIDIKFSGKKRVAAILGDQVIMTDQRPEFGGDGSAPEPFDMFLASLATCAAVYAQGFCENRGVATDKLRLEMKCEYNEEQKLYDKISFNVTLPPDFPEKYKSALIRSIDKCAVKRHIINTPQFETILD